MTSDVLFEVLLRH